MLTTPLGYVIDRFGARTSQITALLAPAATYAAVAFVRDLRTFVPLACLIAIGDAVVKAANGAMTATAVPATEQQRRHRPPGRWWPVWLYWRTPGRPI